MHCLRLPPHFLRNAALQILRLLFTLANPSHWRRRGCQKGGWEHHHLFPSHAPRSARGGNLRLPEPHLVSSVLPDLGKRSGEARTAVFRPRGGQGDPAVAEKASSRVLHVSPEAPCPEGRRIYDPDDWLPIPSMPQPFSPPRLLHVHAANKNYFY